MRTARNRSGNFFVIFVFLGGDGWSKTFTTLSSDTKNDVPAKGVEDTSSKPKEKWTEGHARAKARVGTAVRGRQNPGLKRKEGKWKGKWECVWIG